MAGGVSGARSSRPTQSREVRLTLKPTSVETHLSCEKAPILDFCAARQLAHHAQRLHAHALEFGGGVPPTRLALRASRLATASSSVGGEERAARGGTRAPGERASDGRYRDTAGVSGTACIANKVPLGALFEDDELAPRRELAGYRGEARGVR